MRKRQVKAPKVYLRDSGLMHALLGIASQTELFAHPKVGASWEGFALEQLLGQLQGDPYYWATHSGAEVDLLLMRRRERWAFEIKRTDAPAMTRSMYAALDDLRLDHLWVVYPGERQYALHDRVTALPLTEAVAMGQNQRMTPATSS